MVTEGTPSRFDLADYYACSPDEEHLSHSSPEEAIEEQLDFYGGGSGNAEEVIRLEGNVTVYAYSRKAVDPSLAQRWACGLADTLNEWWSEEEYGDPDGDADGPGDRAFVTAVTTAIQEAIARTTVWACEAAGVRTYTSEVVLAMMREHNPEWFEEKEEPGETPQTGGV